jgi:8-oxo-dGTP pyrophosphatase MutT (NUDIX family)
MVSHKHLPILNGEALYIPFVAAIIERETSDGQKQILVQIREKVSDKAYSGCLEIPGGKMKAFEDVYETVRREVYEESGIRITFIQNQSTRKDYPNKNDVSSLIEPFCVTQMENGPFIGLVFLCKGEGVPVLKTEEAKEARWIDIEELKDIIEKTPEKIYTALLAPLKKYLSQQD